MIMATTAVLGRQFGGAPNFTVPDTKANQAYSAKFAEATIRSEVVRSLEADGTAFLWVPKYPLLDLIEREASIKRRFLMLLADLEASGLSGEDPVNLLQQSLGALPGNAGTWREIIDEPYG